MVFSIFSCCLTGEVAKAPIKEEEPERPKPPEADPQIVAHLMRIIPHATVGNLLSNGCAEFIEIKVNDKKFYAMISTGTTLSFCHPALVQTLNLQEFKVNGLNIQDTSGGQNKFSGYCKANLELGQIFVDEIELLVSEQELPFNLVIGMDVLEVIAKKYGYDFGSNLNHFKFGPFIFPKLRVQCKF